VITTAQLDFKFRNDLSGAKPVFVDIDEYFTIDVAKKRISLHKPKQIPIHIHGQMCNMEAIMEIANRHNIPVIEDCAVPFLRV
jgi:dTDP-4-amino-4,6-dideoxygalactose transaminase